jgi:2-hydroxy-6-oxo-octa-2,4-dienoate hydrolase
MASPALGKTIEAGGFSTNYHDEGEGYPILLLHGSGPGVSAWANWSDIIPLLSDRFRVIAPDLAGFGHTTREGDEPYNIKVWVSHLLAFLDALEIDKAMFVGNSFGGGLTLATAMRHAHRIDRMVLMGTPCSEFEQTEGLASGWLYEPSLENMRKVLELFPYDKSFVTDEMVAARYGPSAEPGAQEAFRKLIPKPNTDGPTMVKGVPEAALQGIEVPALVLHGREDFVIPLELGLKLATNLPNAQLHVFGKCGHWVQVEERERFARLVGDFAAEAA